MFTKAWKTHSELINSAVQQEIGRFNKKEQSSVEIIWFGDTSMKLHWTPLLLVLGVAEKKTSVNEHTLIRSDHTKPAACTFGFQICAQIIAYGKAWHHWNCCTDCWIRDAGSAASTATDLLHGLGQIISPFCAAFSSATSYLTCLLSLDCKSPSQAFSLCAYGQRKAYSETSEMGKLPVSYLLVLASMRFSRMCINDLLVHF